MPQPLLSAAYVAAVRGRSLAPRFTPLLLLALLPLASLAIGLGALRGADADRRRLHLVLVLVAALELVWTIFAQAIVGFALALRSL